ncbi:MAG: DUF6090 family protein [Allomuricauda sp.]
MIKFFRRFRQQLLHENKFTKYLLYAVGEIVLVVIGIFIAIQLNGWNQNRIEKKQLAITLENLKEEFSSTEELLTSISSHYVTSIEANIRLMNLFIAHDGGISAQDIDLLISQSAKQVPFYPPQPVLDELFNSGKIKSISNETLRRNLLEWESNIKWFHFDYDLMITFSNDQFQPYITRHWSWKNIEITEGSEFFDERSTFNVDPNELLQKLEFENLIDTNLFHTNRLYKRLKIIDVLLDNILLQIDNSLSQ